MTKPYQIVFKRSVLKDIRRIPSSILQAIQDRISALAVDPLLPNAEPIEGYQHCYRIRIGNYRVLYEVTTTVRIITIIRIGHRKDIYRNL